MLLHLPRAMIGAHERSPRLWWQTAYECAFRHDHTGSIGTATYLKEACELSFFDLIKEFCDPITTLIVIQKLFKDR